MRIPLTIMAGNAAFAALVWAWWSYVKPDRQLMMAGCLAMFGAILIGTVIGYSLNERTHTNRRATDKSRQAFDPTLLDRIE
jgi:hypothetical protein